ncbi:glycosyltransferase family 4 protein [Bradyrhizobium sp. AZCC 2289]|uniref:glycosyltransferase family 4 protein n=1 Tax=Bradyrhizobium sp. AZCC 2289 TaxID=3117026 RepID=UPI002FF07FFC
MRIAQIAPLAESVPPRLYGGTERVVAWLVDELVSRGHEVTLFASGDSCTKAQLNAIWPRALRLGRPRTDPVAMQAALLEEIARTVSEFDVVHAHIDWLHLPLLSRLGVPFLTTCHGRMDLPGFPDVVGRFPSAPFVSISDNQRVPLREANWIGTVYHGLPPDLFRSAYEAGSYLAFLGRLTVEKGPEAAIRIAHAVEMPLHIAAKVPRGERGYFKERLEPQVDGEKIQLIGEVNDRAKQLFLAGASALLFPIDWPEPFGLVMIEAMACGTPVIAFSSGSVPEVVDDGITGFVVSNEAEAIEAIGRLGELDRRRVRAQFEKRFSAGRMAEDYLRHYQGLSNIKKERVVVGKAETAAFRPSSTSEDGMRNAPLCHDID